MMAVKSSCHFASNNMIIHSMKYGDYEVLYDTCNPDLVAWIESHAWHLVKNGRTFYAETIYSVWGGVIIHTRMHRLIMVSTSEAIDHINENGLDNRSVNLRPCSIRENGFNRRTDIDNTSGFKGVSKHRNSRRWRAQIIIHGKAISLGTYNDKEDAAKAYRDAARIFHRDYFNERGLIKNG